MPASSEPPNDVVATVVEAFVLREGTDYGERVASHEEKVMQVMRQLERGAAKIVFDPVTESVDIVLSEALGRITPTESGRRLEAAGRACITVLERDRGASGSAHVLTLIIGSRMKGSRARTTKRYRSNSA